MITPMTTQHWNKTIANHLKKGPEGKEGGGGGGVGRWHNAENVYLSF